MTKGDVHYCRHCGGLHHAYECTKHHQRERHYQRDHRREEEERKEEETRVVVEPSPMIDTPPPRVDSRTDTPRVDSRTPRVDSRVDTPRVDARIDTTRIDTPRVETQSICHEAHWMRWVIGSLVVLFFISIVIGSVPSNMGVQAGSIVMAMLLLAVVLFMCWYFCVRTKPPHYARIGSSL